MNATTKPAAFPNAHPAAAAAPSGAAQRFVIRVGDAECAVRVRAIEPIAAVLGFEEEMDMAAGLIDHGGGATAGMVADLLESRMIAPPRPRHRRQRAVSSRALFFGRGG